MAGSDENGRPVDAEDLEEQTEDTGEHPALDPETVARRQRALSADPDLRRPRAAGQRRRRHALRRLAARGGRAHGRPDGRRPRPRPRGHPAGRDAPAVRVPGRPGRAAGRGRQPTARVVLPGPGDRRGGLPQPAPRARSTSSARCTCASAPSDERGEPILLEASGLEARVIQHEMDHLDGVLILDRTTREQRKEALRALRGGGEPTSTSTTTSRAAAPAARAERRAVRTVFLGSSSFAVVVLSALAESAASLRCWSSPRPTGRRAAAARPRRRRRRSRHATSAYRVLQAASVNDPEARAAIDAARARRDRRVRVRAADPRAAAVARPDAERAPVPAAAVARRRADRARADGGRHAHRRDDLQARPRDSTAGRWRSSARSRSTPTTRAGRLRHGLPRLGGELLIESFDAAEAGALELTEQPEEGVTYAEKITPAERRLDPSRPAVELERVVRALTPGIGAFLELEGGERLGVESARAVDEPLEQGEVRVVEGRLLVGCADGALRAGHREARRRARDAGGRLPARAHATCARRRLAPPWPRRPAAAPSR